MTRPHTLCPGNRLCCPNPECGRPIPLLTARNGDGFAVCGRKVRYGRGHRPCGQHLFWSCSDLLCIVVAITAAEHARFATSHATRDAVLAELGVRVAGLADGEQEQAA